MKKRTLLGRVCCAKREKSKQRHTGGNVVWGAAEGVGHGAVDNVLLGHAHVGNLNVTVGAEHHIVELEVADKVGVGWGRER